MTSFKQLITRASIATAMITISLSSLPANADTYSSSKTCTHDPVNNRTECRQKIRSSTRRSSSSSSSRSHFNINVSKPDVENLVNDLLVPKRRNPSKGDRHNRRHRVPSIYF